MREENIVFFKLPTELREACIYKFVEYVCDHFFWMLVGNDPALTGNAPPTLVNEKIGMFGGFEVDGKDHNVILCRDCEAYWRKAHAKATIKPTPDLRPPKLFTPEEIKRMWGHVKVQPVKR